MLDGSSTTTRIKQQLALSELVGQYIDLKRKGDKWWGRCPLPEHDDKTPSFQVDDSRGVFHCFGCNNHGDHFDLVQKMEGLDFRQSLEKLAHSTGISISHHVGQNRAAKEALLALNEAAMQFYQQQLKKTPEAQRYLEARGLQKETIALFKLGATVPSQWDALYQKLRKEFSDEVLDRSGLFKQGNYGKYDLFRDRIIFPIQGENGQTIGFGGRILPSVANSNPSRNIPKYINSPETPVFKKAQHLYNLHLAKAYLKKNPEVLVVEGYLDTISLYQAGIHNVVAPLGTAFTSDQSKLLKKFANTAILNFDGDAAGQKAVESSIPILLASDTDIRVLTLPPKMDPDEFIRKQGLDAYLQAIKQSPDFYPYLLERFSVDGRSTEIRSKNELANKMLRVLDQIPEPMIKEHYLGQLAADLQVSTDTLRDQINKINHQRTNSKDQFSYGSEVRRPSTNETHLMVEKAGAQINRPFVITSARQAFLGHIMTEPQLVNKLKPAQLKLLQSLATHHFGKKLDAFIFASESNINSRLELAPEHYRNKLRLIATADFPKGLTCFEKTINALAREMALDKLKNKSFASQAKADSPYQTKTRAAKLDFYQATL